MAFILNRKSIGWFIGIKASLFILGLAATLTPAFAQTASNDRTTLEVSSQIDVKAAPDLAEISAGVLNIDKTAQEALKNNATKMSAVFTALKGAGIAEKDIQTTGITINAQYVYEEHKDPRITGYQAVNTVSVKLRDMKAIGKVLDTLVAQGANQLNGPTFSVEDPDTTLDSARKDAVIKAQKRAELYASAAGLKVKRIINMSEAVSNGQPQPYPAMAKRMMAADASSSPVASGEVGLSLTVNVTYELGN